MRYICLLLLFWPLLSESKPPIRSIKSIVVSQCVGSELTCLVADWADVPGAVNYDLRHAPTETECYTGTSTLVSDLVYSTYQLPDLSVGTTRWFKARAKDSVGNVAAYSSCFSGTTMAADGGDPTDSGNASNLAGGTNFDSMALGGLTSTPFTMEWGGTLNNSTGNSPAPTVTSSPICGGSGRAARFRLAAGNGSSSAPYRSQFAVRKYRGQGETSWEGMENWIGFHVRLDAAYPDTSPGYMFLAGFHTDQAGKSYSGGPVSLRTASNGQWRISGEQGVNTKTDVGDYTVDKGQCVGWIFRIVYRSTATGIIQVWKNGVLVVNRQNVVTLESGNVRSPYFKIGPYNNHCRTKACPEYNLVIDNFRIGFGPNNFNAVNPAQ